VKRHISPLPRHLSDAYKDVRGVKVTMKEGKYVLHRPCCLLYTDAIEARGRKMERNIKTMENKYLLPSFEMVDEKEDIIGYAMFSRFQFGIEDGPNIKLPHPDRCFGWSDGQMQSIGDKTYKKLKPRKKYCRNTNRPSYGKANRNLWGKYDT